MTRAKPKTAKELLDDPRLDADSRAYGKACIEGKKKAELYLKELQQNPSLVGMPLMGTYLEKFRPYPKNSRVKGLLVGFTARVEAEFGRLVVDDIWRSVSPRDRWRAAMKLSEGVKDPALMRQLKDQMLARLKAGDKPSPEDWKELIGCLDGHALSQIERVIESIGNK